MDKLFQVPATITKIETMQEWVRIAFDTQEVPDLTELAKLLSMGKGKVGWLLFKETEIQHEDIPEYNPNVDDEERSPSERLRAVMYVYFMQQGGKKEKFTEYYRKAMEKRIQEFKDRLVQG